MPNSLCTGLKVLHIILYYYIISVLKDNTLKGTTLTINTSTYNTKVLVIAYTCFLLFDYFCKDIYN